MVETERLQEGERGQYLCLFVAGTEEQEVYMRGKTQN